MDGVLRVRFVHGGDVEGGSRKETTFAHVIEDVFCARTFACLDLWNMRRVRLAASGTQESW